MTWSISASGKKAAVLETVNNHTAPDFGEKEKAAYEGAKAHVKSVVEATPDDFEVSVSCSGHTTTKDDQHVAASQSLSISAWKPDAPNG